MGLLDSNKFFLGSKKVEVIDKSVTANGYVNDGGLMDVRSFNTAIVYISGTFAEGVTMNVRPFVGVKNSGSTAFYCNAINIVNDVVVNAITTNGSYIVDISQYARFGLISGVTGTYNSEIYLTSKEFNENDVNILSALSEIKQSLHTTEISTVYDIPTSVSQVFPKKTLGGNYKTVCIDVKLTDDTTGTSLFVNGFTNTGVNLNVTNLIVIDVFGNVSRIIKKSGIYYVDITGFEAFVIRQEGSNNSAGKLCYKLLAYETPHDYKPIQSLGKSTTITLTQNRRYCEPVFSLINIPISVFKYLRVNLTYTGEASPSGNINFRVYGDSGELKKLEDFSGKIYFTKWYENFYNPNSTAMYFRINFADDFSPSANDTLQLELYGIR